MTPPAQPHQDTEERLREMRLNAESRLNDYGTENDWQKMRADEMAEVALAEVPDLLADLDRYRKALEFYADDNQWRAPGRRGGSMPEPASPSAISYDAGKRARAALNPSEDTPGG